MKKLLSLVLVMVMLMCFSACDPSDEVHVMDTLSVLLDGYPVELFQEILKEPMLIDEIKDGSITAAHEEKTLKWQEELNEIYADVAEPGKVVDVYMGIDLMTLWMYMIINDADFELKELEITDMPSDTSAAYSAVITVTQSGGGKAEAAFSGTVQLNEDGLINYLQIHSLDEVCTSLGMDLRWR